ncbi:MAG: iron ABC transporter permease [Prevotellaceae bacterium]|jgi:iron complex transport system permease protein|nr:iron ABC transporter permease [Prevotellaceae bacterium]
MHLPQRNRKVAAFSVALAALMLLLLVADVLVGSEPIPLSTAWRALLGAEPSHFSHIILSYRLPKAAVALLVGVSLSVSGLQMQTMFRNPLADPYILGVSAGAGLGVALLVMGRSIWGATAVGALLASMGYAVAACAGAAVVMLIMLAISMRVRDIMAVLILGVMIGSATAALIGVLQYFSREAALKSYVLWTMGGLGNVTSAQLAVLLAVTLVGSALALLSVKTLNALMLGEHYARSIGYSVGKRRLLIMLTATMLTGTATAFCGPIGFIGVATPHVARMLIREADHRYLLPVTMLLGAVVMLLCDIISSLPGYETSLPINTVTALLGIPIVILVIMRNQKVV